MNLSSYELKNRAWRKATLVAAFSLATPLAFAVTPQDLATSLQGVSTPPSAIATHHKVTRKRRTKKYAAAPLSSEPVIATPELIHPITSLPKAPGDTSGSFPAIPSSRDYADAPVSGTEVTTPPAARAPTSIVPLSEGLAPSPSAPAVTEAAPSAAAPQAPAVVFTQPGQSIPASDLPSTPSASTPSKPRYTPPPMQLPAQVDVGPPPVQASVTDDSGLHQRVHDRDSVLVDRLHVRPFSAIAVQVKAGFAGVGLDIATPLAQRFNLRVGGSYFRYNHTYYSDGLAITGDAKFQSGSAALDIFPFDNGFRISPGITFYNGNKFNANVNVPGNTSFDLGDSQPSLSDPKDPVTGTADMSFGKRYAPSLTLGWGNMIPRSGKHLSFPFEIGAQYIDNPSMAITLSGSSCDLNGNNCTKIATDPIAQQNLRQEISDINNTLHTYFRFYPIVSIGVAWRFGSWK